MLQMSEGPSTKNLLDLPDELLIKIIDIVSSFRQPQPTQYQHGLLAALGYSEAIYGFGGYETLEVLKGLCCTSKKCYELCLDFLVHTYSKFGNEFARSASYLRMIAQDQKASVKSAFLSGHTIPILQKSVRAGISSGILEQPWAETLSKGDRLAPLRLVLGMLPNLQNLSIHVGNSSDWPLELFETKKAFAAIFGNLRKASISGSKSSFGLLMDPNVFSFLVGNLLGLQNLEVLELYHVGKVENSIQSAWPSSSSVKRLSIVEDRLFSEQTVAWFRQLSKSLNGLQDFRFFCHDLNCAQAAIEMLSELLVEHQETLEAVDIQPVYFETKVLKSLRKLKFLHCRVVTSIYAGDLPDGLEQVCIFGCSENIINTIKDLLERRKERSLSRLHRLILVRGRLEWSKFYRSWNFQERLDELESLGIEVIQDLQGSDTRDAVLYWSPVSSLV